MLHSSSNPPFLRTVLLCTALLLSLPTQAATSTSKAITVGCANPGNAEAFDAAFTEATLQRHSLQQLTCAALMSANQAARMRGDVDMQMLALDSQINLLDALQMQLETQVYQGGEAFDDIKARWALAIKQGRALVPRLQKAAQSVPSIDGLLIAFDLVAVSSMLVDVEQAYPVAARAIKPLAALLKKNPQLLDGLGEMMLGRLYFQLPEAAGGDLDLAVVHLALAHNTNKKSLLFQRWYAEALLAVGRKEDARQMLSKMLTPKPEPIDRQSFADEMRAGIGLAYRAGDVALSEQITAKRAALLAEFPYLLTRQRAALYGHGGPDPLTGKSTD